MNTGSSNVAISFDSRLQFASNSTNSTGFDVNEVRRVFFGIGIPFLVLWAAVTPFILFWFLKGCRKTWRYDKQYFKNHPFMWFLSFLWLFVEFGQVNWFSFNMNLEWPGKPFTEFLNVFLLYFNLPWEAWFWIYASFSILVLLICLSTMCCCDGGDDIATIAAWILLTMIPVFQPIMYRMVQALTCTYPIGRPPFLDAEPTMICWEGLHLLYAVVACSIVGIFYPLISIVMSVLFAPGYSERPIWVFFGFMQFKMIQVVITAMFYPYVLGILLALLGINITFVLLSIGMPSTSNLVNFLRFVSMLMCAWATFCILVQYGVNNPNNWVGVILLIIGWTFIPLITFIFMRRFWFPPPAPEITDDNKNASEMPPVSPPPPPAVDNTPSRPSFSGDIHIHQVQYMPVPVHAAAEASHGAPGSRPPSAYSANNAPIVVGTPVPQGIPMAQGVPVVQGVPVAQSMPISTAVPVQPAYPVN